MKISCQWLKQYAAITASPSEIAAMLTGCGLEVEEMVARQSIPGGLEGMVVGEVLEKIKHPNADKLSVTKVTTGDGRIYQIVCGAPNVEAGQKVIVAMVGAMLYPISGEPFQIKKSKIRGEESEGMICAEDEIGMGASHSGIMVLPSEAITGTPAAEYFNLETDYIFEIGLTPNRADATSHIGVARDVIAVINAMQKTEEKSSQPLVINLPSTDEFLPAITSPIKVQVKDSRYCQRYSGIYITGLEVKESPEWLKNRLISIGLKPINNVVDITNFVMWESGQPLHAFDAARIRGNEIIIKKLPDQTSFITLDGTERKLNGEELMICDTSGGLCLAGLYGGLESGVTASTASVFLESACFNPILIRKASKIHGLKTDASFRFERGSDPWITITALKRAAGLFKESCPGISYSDVTDIYPEPVPAAPVELDLKKLDALAGIHIREDVIDVILKSIDIVITKNNSEILSLEVPPRKPDVKRPVDVMEEILRIYGYNNVPLPLKMNSNLPQYPRPGRMSVQSKISAYLSAQGFYEILGNSLTKAAYAEEKGLPGEPVKMLNPLSNDLSVLRQSLLFSGLEAIHYNKNRKNPDVRFFEFGKIYYTLNGTYKEEERLCIMVAGMRHKPHWISGEADYSMYYLKSLLQNVLLQSGIRQVDIPQISQGQHDLYAVYVSYHRGSKELAIAGLLKKNFVKKFNLEGDVFIIDVNMDILMGLINRKEISIQEAPRFPEVKRDLSLLLDKSISFDSVEKTALETERKLLKKIQLFDVYQGDKLDTGKKSYAVSFILGDDQKTLEEKQIEVIMEKLMKSFEQKLGAVIRKT
jgi:phenylalanyl-tRNA synthetase beta chain